MSMGTAIICALGADAAVCPPAPPGVSNPYGAASNTSLTQAYYPATADCIEYTVPITIAYDQVTFNFTQWEDDYQLEQFLADATTRAGADFPTIVSGTTPASGSYEIAASFCTPKKPNGKEKTVVLATHGIGPGREHWNSAYKPEEYSFVQWAIAQGYSVFLYDRLGCGLSSKLVPISPDTSCSILMFDLSISGYQAQLNTHVAVLQQLATIIKGGEYTGDIGKPSKLALMGFSFGSYITHNTIATYPELADAVILTAIGLNLTVGVNGNGLLRSFVPRIASLQDATRFGELDTGYITWVDKFAQLENYFHYPYYETGTIDYVEDVKQAFSIGEFLTFPTVISAANFTGAALAITAETDYIVCDGWCPGIYDEPAETLYSNAKSFERVLHPNASHSINFHFNATGAYKVITDFLGSNGL
ncbi:hypothetical protein LTR53_002655 [Teratosphaeriaceae sp. CCFEE 6253]|nr:hypothetical protein LTR53_002655 [Teratosphaeriaceae sp. CCFEE 6253]